MRLVLRGLPASLAAMALLPACGTNGVNSGTPNPATVATTSAAIAAPVTTQGLRTKKWIDLDVGDCLADPPPTDPSVVTVALADCAAQHQAEVYLRAPMAVNAAIADVANRDCVAGFSQYTGRRIDGSPFAMTYLVDSDQDRTSSDPAPSTLICLLQAANGGPLTASARR